MSLRRNIGSRKRNVVPNTNEPILEPSEQKIISEDMTEVQLQNRIDAIDKQIEENKQDPMYYSAISPKREQNDELTSERYELTNALGRLKSENPD